MASGLISDDDIQKVRDATDIVQLVSERVQLKPRGREFWGCCPLHNEKTPSFKVDPSSQFWHCFGCDEGGDIFGFVMKLNGLSFPEAVRKLAERSNIEITETQQNPQLKSKKDKLKEICAATANFYHTQLMRGKGAAPEAARKYLSDRGFGGNIPKEWMLGFSPGYTTLVDELLRLGFKPDDMVLANVANYGKDGKLRDRFFNRVMFPIFDIQGNCIAFGGRVIGEGSPKYLNSQETPIFHKSEVLYGLDKAKAMMASTGCAIVTEGYTDVIAMHKAGLKNTVATLGTALSPRHIRILSRQANKRIVYLFDGDEAGKRATERALQFIDETITPEFGASKIDICALSLPDGKDPAEFLSSSSAENMKELIDNAKPLIFYGIERRLERHSTSTAEDRARALSDALQILGPIKDSILAKDYAVQIAGMLGYRDEDVLKALSEVKTRSLSQADQSENRPQSNTAKTQHSPRINASLSNRFAIERELLALCCSSPLDILSHAEILSNIKWADELHSNIAKTLLDTLMSNLEASPTDLLLACTEKYPQSQNILTSSISSSESAPNNLILFMLEELKIADLENEIAQIKSSLTGVVSPKVEGDNSIDSQDSNFEKMVRLQEELADIKKSHKSVV